MGWINGILRPGAWRTTDDRGAARAMFNPYDAAVGLGRSDVAPAERKKLRKAASSRFAIVMGIWCIFALFPLSFSWFQGLSRLTTTGEWSSALGFSLVFTAVWFSSGFKAVFGLWNKPKKFRDAMLALCRCPACAYRLEGCTPDPADACTVCPECGAAWRLDAVAPPQAGTTTGA